ncbi:MAG: flagellar protein export ATPase FliI [Rhodospirillaceae bacterium]
MSESRLCSGLINEISQIAESRVYGRVAAVLGMLVEVAGVPLALSVGDRCLVGARNGRNVLCEVIGFRDGRALVMPFQSLEGIGPGCKATILPSQTSIRPDESWLGRVVNAMGEPIDDKGPLGDGPVACPLRAPALPAHRREMVNEKIDLGVRALNTFVSCCRGQRMGIFAGSGVGKSVLLSMLATYTKADVNVIGLIGERGREVNEFIQESLGEEGLARSVIVVATSDESPLMRRQAAYQTLAIAEYFRDRGRDVLCMMDSLTRFAMAQREIGLSAGEPPASKGYTPTVFAELPRLLERAGPGLSGSGTITGLFTVLVEGDDHDEPVADAVRSIVDGHIVLDRSIAEKGRYPAINILRSISRTMPSCNDDRENALVQRARRLMSAYEDMEEMIRLGAYRPGSDPRTDEAIAYHDRLEEFLGQRKSEGTDLETGYAMLESILGGAGK